jgi:protein-tyrosine-phosphatase
MDNTVPQTRGKLPLAARFIVTEAAELLWQSHIALSCPARLGDLPVAPDIVVTVCSSAAGEICSAYLGSVLRTHWGLEDPSHVVGTEEEIEAAFNHAYGIIRARIEAFLALPLAGLKNDEAALRAELDRIGAIQA